MTAVILGRMHTYTYLHICINCQQDVTFVMNMEKLKNLSLMPVGSTWAKLTDEAE
jgi:hypothetical protein